MKRIVEPISQRLHVFLSYADQLIQANADKAMKASDDLIQMKYAYGGLCEEGGNVYYFRYFPGVDIVTTWDLRLQKDEIFAIAKGRVTEIHLWRCDSERCQNRFMSEESSCLYCRCWNGRGLARPDAGDEDRCSSQLEWLQLFVHLNPEASGMDSYFAYGLTPGLAHRLGQPPVEWMTKPRLLG